MHRIIPALLIIVSLAACASFQTRSAVRTSNDLRSEKISPSVVGLTSDDRAPQTSIVNAEREIANGPTTERAIGVAGLGVEVVVLTIFFIGFYKLATLLR